MAASPSCAKSASLKAHMMPSQRGTLRVLVNMPSCQLSEDYNRLFESEQFGDVVFKLDDFELRAHKAILVARSPVFASMFEHEMVESIQSQVDVTDIDHESIP
ncbi:hypothetical protein HPB48_004138 [Haemaphysalis longicornis]|uniref:BTB domain-containing protein n=1 Tax=Haemaphysalis longicornis TaxID=44386 RepID=A0A9J6FMX7_HAELO|nr:hypothetical protein HPB48_004138 [Haemaphysalis longicornis]